MFLLLAKALSIVWFSLKALVLCPEQYTINSSQDQFAFLFYNTEDRNGAEDEATNLHSSLSDIGFEATLTEWDNISSLPSIITGKLEYLPSTASIVMICIMSHGRAGTLSDGRGSQIPLNYILHQLSQAIPNDIPLVSWPDIKSKTIIIQLLKWQWGWSGCPGSGWQTKITCSFDTIVSSHLM